MLKAKIVLPPPPKLNFEIGYKFCPEVGLFLKPAMIKQGSLEISFCDPELIVFKINKYIETFEGLKIIQHDSHKKLWKIEYGTNRLERIIKALNWESIYYSNLGERFDNLVSMEDSIEKYKSNRLIERKIGSKKWWADCATFKAKEKFKSAGNYDDDDNYDINLKWTKFTIALFYDEDKNKIIIEFHNPFRNIDDKSYYYFRQEIINLLQNTA
jgi:hypothetical protein